LPETFHGKEGVDGSSPSEGLFDMQGFSAPMCSGEHGRPSSREH
jgi:hypothetical protein